MVAVAGSRLTTDIILQMTATLAHISNLQQLQLPDNHTLTFIETNRGLGCYKLVFYCCLSAGNLFVTSLQIFYLMPQKAKCLIHQLSVSVIYMGKMENCFICDKIYHQVIENKSVQRESKNCQYPCYRFHPNENYRVPISTTQIFEIDYLEK